MKIREYFPGTPSFPSKAEFDKLKIYQRFITGLSVAIISIATVGIGTFPLLKVLINKFSVLNNTSNNTVKKTNKKGQKVLSSKTSLSPSSQIIKKQSQTPIQSPKGKPILNKEKVTIPDAISDHFADNLKKVASRLYEPSMTVHDLVLKIQKEGNEEEKELAVRMEDRGKYPPPPIALPDPLLLERTLEEQVIDALLKNHEASLKENPESNTP